MTFCSGFPEAARRDCSSSRPTLLSSAARTIIVTAAAPMTRNAANPGGTRRSSFSTGESLARRGAAEVRSLDQPTAIALDHVVGRRSPKLRPAPLDRHQLRDVDTSGVAVGATSADMQDDLLDAGLLMR